MSKTIEFNVARKGADNLTSVETGKVAWFQLGGQRIKFVIQDNGLSGVSLTHFASGQLVAKREVIASIRISNWAQSFNGCVTDREACRQALCKLEKRHGLPRIFSVFAGADIINK